jgi:hypothetical protein
MPAAHLRDDTETARVVASFGDFQIDAVGWRETKARGVPIRNVSWLRRDEVVTGDVDPGRSRNGLSAVESALPARTRSMIAPSSRTWSSPMNASTSGNETRSSAAKRCDMQPLTISFWLGRFPSSRC